MIDIASLFDKFRKACDAIDAIHTAQASSVKAAVDALLAEYDFSSVEEYVLAQQLTPVAEQWYAETQLAEAVRTMVSATIVKAVYDDVPREGGSIDAAIAELLRQMDNSSDTVERNVVSATVTPPDSNAPTLAVSVLNADGTTNQQVIPETLTASHQSATVLRITAEAKEFQSLAAAWPAGSGANSSLNVLTADSSLLTNASFDLDTQRTNTPDDWTISIGTIGTTITMTVTEVQTVTIAGDPTSGTYTLTWTRVDGAVLTTSPLGFDASGADVEAALSALPGLSEVTVETSGNSPNYVHTISFNAVAPAGNQPMLSSSNSFDTGTISHAQVTAGSDYSKLYRAMAYIGNGSQLTEVRQVVENLQPTTAYGFSIALKKDNAGASGVIAISLVDGSGTVINDDAGTANTLSVNVSAISSSGFANHTAFFRTPESLPPVVYLRIKASTAISNGHGVYFDEAILAVPTPLYDGGPVAFAAAGTRDLAASDRYSVAVANNLAGRLQTYFGRMFSTQLPSATSGSETIAD